MTIIRIALIIAIVSVPTLSRAQTIRESVTAISVADIQRVVPSPHARRMQAHPTPNRKHSVRRNAIVGALIGLAPGLAAGLFIYKYCNNEVVGGCSVGVPIGLAATGAGIGAALGAAGTDR